jgi:hypothetical protein
VDTLKSGAQVIKSITEVARAWGRYHQEKADAAAAAAEADRLASEEQEANDLIVASVQKMIIEEEAAARAAAGLPDDCEIKLPFAPDVVAANSAAADEYLAGAVAEFPASQMGKANPDEQFKADVGRQLNVTLNGETMAKELGDIPGADTSLTYDARTAVLLENANNQFARFITGDSDATFAGLTDVQKREVYLMESLCNQGLEIPTATAGKKGLFGPDFNNAVVGSSSGSEDRKFTIDRDGDNFVFKSVSLYHVGSISDFNREPFYTYPVDRATSTEHSSVGFTFSKAELTRMASLNWQNVGNRLQPPAEYQLKFFDLYRSYSLDLHKGSWD